MKKIFVIAMSILFFLICGLIVFAKLKIQHIDYYEYIKTNPYCIVPSESYQRMYEGLDLFLIEHDNITLEELQNFADYILVVETKDEPTLKGNGIINNCIVKQILKGDNIREHDLIKIYDLIMDKTNYMGGSTPLKVGNEYIVFLRKTIRANVPNSFVFVNSKYGHISLTENLGILENYETCSKNIEFISNYDFVFTENNESEISDYNKLKEEILKFYELNI